MSMGSPQKIRCDWPVSELVRHAAPMALIEHVSDATTNSLSALATIDTHSPFYAGEKELPAWWSVEYLAQGVATLAGLKARAEGREPPGGFLTGCRNFSCSSPGIPLGTTVKIIVQELISLNGSLGAYDCRLESEVFTATSRITVFSIGDSDRDE
jgi:predicted hotdog family 3-hydroxylacyl-ACP dehydratase